MVKAYLRYEPRAVFGVVASGDCNICFDATGKQVLAPALESVNVWNLRKGVCSKILTPQHSGPALSVTSIAASSSFAYASGYADGSIRIWDGEDGSCQTALSGHKGAVTALRYNKLGSLLASGSKDNDVILWDVVGETGLFRLRGHRDQVTDLVFLDSGKKLASCSKDKYLRVWDLETQHCIQIVSGHHSEIWSMDVDSKEQYLVTGSADPELRFYKIKCESPDSQPVDQNGNSKENRWDVLKYYGEIRRQNRDGKDRVETVRFNKSGNLLGCQEAGKTIELYKVLDELEAMHKAKRRIKRKKEKKSSTGANEDSQALSAENPSAPTVLVTDVFRFLQSLRTSKKIYSFSFSPLTPNNSFLASLAVSLNNNQVELYAVQSDTTSKVLTIDLQGHRSDIRSVALSSDNTLLMSTSHNTAKIWNSSTGTCLRTIESKFGLCGAFVPGNRYALVGTKSGKVEIIDIGSGSCIEEIDAHADSVQSIALIPDGSGFVSGSVDQDIKFWAYRDKSDGSKQLTAGWVKTLNVKSEVAAVAISPDAKYVAVALLDNIAKVFFMDTGKFYLSLFGHALTILCIDISSDGNLIVTGSADKKLKIWGLDFGDCHRSISAHADSVMAVQFVRNTHYMFSVGKDRLVKYWDADKFELLLTLEGHHSSVWCLAVSNRGDFVVTGSSDRSIRRWDRTEEPFFIEEEKEKRLEEMFESSFDDPFESRHAPKEDLPEEGAVALAGKKTKETLTATDLIIDALDMAEVELKRISQHKEDEQGGGIKNDFQPNVLMLGLSPSDYVLRAVSNVRTNDLEQTLLSLPFSDALNLMSYLKEWVSNPDKVELVCRVATILLQTHHNQLITTPAAKPILSILKDILHQTVKECKDTIGFNLAAMDHLKQLMSLRSDAPFRYAKTKLMEIRLWHSKRLEEKTELSKERKRRKKQKS